MCNAFEYAKKLKSIKLFGHQIASIEDYALNGFSELNYIYLNTTLTVLKLKRTRSQDLQIFGFYKIYIIVAVTYEVGRERCIRHTEIRIHYPKEIECDCLTGKQSLSDIIFSGAPKFLVIAIDENVLKHIEKVF